MNLDYLIASLPMLRPGHLPPMPIADFRALCAEKLDGPLRTAVLALLDDTPCEHPFAREWRERETGLRNAIARRRAARRGIEARPWLHHAQDGDDLRIERGVAAAFEQPDPLQRERALDRLRWQIADAMQGIQPMTQEVVLAYAIKLRLLTRWSVLDEEIGRSRLEELAKLPD